MRLWRAANLLDNPAQVLQVASANVDTRPHRDAPASAQDANFDPVLWRYLHH